MKKFVALSIVACMATAGFADADMDALKSQMESLKAKIAELEAKQNGTEAKLEAKLSGSETLVSDLATVKKTLTDIKTKTGGDNIKWDIDMRTAYDNIHYKKANGDTAGNNALWTNRLLLGMKAAPRSDLSFIGQLSYNKAFGDTASHSQSNTQPGYANFDWVTNENATDNTVKVKSAYVLYFGQAGDVPYTASIGRRPSVNGAPLNLREDEAAQSPLSHMINVEFDGASFFFDLEKVVGIPGASVKLCMGQGLTNAKQRFSMDGLDYAKDSTKNETIDMIGLIAVPYNDGQYSATIQAFKAFNLIGYTQSAMGAWQTAYGNVLGGTASGNDVLTYMNGIPFSNVGDMYGLTVTTMAKGIGSGINSFLDDTTAFVSFAMSKTDPNNKGMLGSTESQTGTSWYAGVQMPAVITEGKIGFEYNQGSKYWRSFTYGEDTLVGSKLAARGKAYEAYYTHPIFKELSAQVRYTMIKYDYTGSNSFFGAEGTPMTMEAAQAAYQNPVKESNDLRLVFRYRY